MGTVFEPISAGTADNDDQGSLADAEKIEAPRNIRQMIERNLQRLSPDEQGILEAASVAGAEFSAAAIAAALQQPASEIEACCTALARREQFVGYPRHQDLARRYCCSEYSFPTLALSRSALRPHTARLSPRVARADSRTNRASYGKRTAEIAAELANHYRQANRATRYSITFTMKSGFRGCSHSLPSGSYAR
jgi:hypothetical protein